MPVNFTLIFGGDNPPKILAIAQNPFKFYDWFKIKFLNGRAPDDNVFILELQQCEAKTLLSKMTNKRPSAFFPTPGPY